MQLHQHCNTTNNVKTFRIWIKLWSKSAAKRRLLVKAFCEKNGQELMIFVSLAQYDQMARLFLQYLSIQNKKFAQKYKIFAQAGSHFCQILNTFSRNGQTIFKILPKWRNFDKSGNTAVAALQRFLHIYFRVLFYSRKEPNAKENSLGVKNEVW